MYIYTFVYILFTSLRHCSNSEPAGHATFAAGFLRGFQEGQVGVLKCGKLENPDPYCQQGHTLYSSCIYIHIHMYIILNVYINNTYIYIYVCVCFIYILYYYVFYFHTLFKILIFNFHHCLNTSSVLGSLVALERV